MNPTTPKRQKPDFRQYVNGLNTTFGLEIPLPGIESPSTRESNTTLPYQVYKHLRPLFYNGKFIHESLRADLDDWIRGTAGLQTRGRNAPPLPAPTPKQRDERTRYLLKLIDDEQYLIGNGRQENEKRLACDSLGPVKGLSRKKRRITDDEDEYHTAPNSPTKESGLSMAQPPPGAYGNGSFQMPQMPKKTQARSQARSFSGASNSLGGQDHHIPPKKTEGTSQAPAKYSASFPVPPKPQGNHPLRNRGFPKVLSKPQPGPYSPARGQASTPSSSSTAQGIFKSPARPSESPKAVVSPLRQTKISAWMQKQSPIVVAPQEIDSAEFKKPQLLDTLTAAANQQKYDDTIVPPSANTSFSTRTSSLADLSHDAMDQSFDTVMTEITDPVDTQSTYADSVVDVMTSEEMLRSFDAATTSMMVNHDPIETNESLKQDILDELLSQGPFSKGSFPAKIPLKFRYELEQVGRAWDVPCNRMLVGDHVPHETQEKFWAWIAGNNQRNRNPLPERSSTRAWECAIDSFKSKKQSEVVVLSGEMDWCDESEPGIFKLKLNPLKTERTCRFHRRFGSDRFLTITVPAPSRPPLHQKIDSSALQQCMATWLTRHDHTCLGRTWRAFYVEEVNIKRKVKGEPRFRVEFFAVSGGDFEPWSRKIFPAISAPRLQGERPTPMSVAKLLEWHMPNAANANQSNCKLFQRISLGLSKTFDTVTVRPSQIFRLEDVKGRPVMNDGCALMSRALANKICDRLGITTATPSCFQGRIAGAKGLWMVDRHQSSIEAEPVDGEDIWIQISDSQLKIHPHPQEWVGPCDEEKLTFEVVNWAKPLHPVDLNIQLLGILQHGAGAPVKDYIAQLIQNGVQRLYDDFLAVLKTNSPVSCRALLQKLKPSGDDPTGKARRLEEWTANEAESIIRYSEAGFAPRDFYPLRVKLRKYLTWLLDRQVEELKIEVPLSTYAYCIADPYGVLEADEVHFGFSSNWRDPNGQFEDNLLDGVDVLVGRLPAHVPSDIQRRRAVWKHDLHHFKDVIVFPTKGNVPLAHMLSGGDYDGDTPWVCWDPMIVNNFKNSSLPSEYPPDHYGLTKHSVPMSELETTEDFLRSAFEFNLTTSNLGRCTVEHEKLAYEESIDSPKAKELACLLSHLVDSRKGGVLLSDQAWKAFRKTLSPKLRALPAYRPGSTRKPKLSNIVDFLKFSVAKSEEIRILSGLNTAFPEHEIQEDIDQDLIVPWTEAKNAAAEESKHQKKLQAALNGIRTSIETLFEKWLEGNAASEGFSPLSREAVESASGIPPPEGNHPLIHTWQNSRDEWLRVLASYTYQRYPRTGFVLHAFGETLCHMKASCSASRLVVDEIIATYRVNQKMVSHLTATEVPGIEADSDLDDYEGGDVIEAMISFG
ncbi:unnamed protein product [Penicillium salamii]|uniref:RNA-dependent RNA polymerase n=1 Tax=Penicillium salamii TaxID=1612424 RepID=A0A9W4JHR9_9EURO|nr:unnamed protein product [Penicillium salamii]CAG8333810.1 unnamed protein product [Penicillium salamii]CAG8340921.1 unnamed protein product [Penicillium salamii]CAG8382189.1 unnamed protein product [Penicillium salamii]CAG8388178.1 unnamed protein product [Penicillium salamii]